MTTIVKRVVLTILPVFISLISCNSPVNTDSHSTSNNDSLNSKTDTNQLIYEDEKHFKNLTQLTFGGDNAEAYWSFDDNQLVFQSNYDKWNTGCDQIFITSWKSDDLKTSQAKLVSTGMGRTTCSYFLPGDSTIVYASTHLGDKNCPPVPERRSDGKYVWPIYPDFDIFVADMNGTIINQLTDDAGYDAEATVSPKGDKIVFTSLRSGDLELYTMNIDGSDVKQITSELGYDGGAFFSPNGEQLVFRASRPTTEEEINTYKTLLSEGLVMPTDMELYTCNVDGSNMKQITNLGKANWCPFFHPSGNKIIFSSNHESERGFPFNLYLINTDGTGLEKVTHDKTFDAFPVFSNDGKHLVFSSNRNNGGTRETNLFVAEWMN